MNPICRDARAKVNLTLEVKHRREDGYHEIESLVTFAQLADRLEFSPAPTNKISLQLSGAFAKDVAAGEENILLRAATLFAGKHGISLGWDIKLEKNVPAAAGLGGGSSDAAAMLAILAELHGGEQEALALSLGADVLACLYAQRGTSAMMMRGWGERIEPVAALPEVPLLLVKPSGALSTEEVYRRWDDTTARNDGQGGNPPADMNLEALVSWCRQRPNDLEAAAMSLLPELRDVLDALGKTQSCLLARMSGSGPVCFGIYQNRQAVERARDKLAQTHPDWWLHADSITAS